MFAFIRGFWGANSLPITGVIVLALGLWIGSLELRLGVAHGDVAQLKGENASLTQSLDDVKKEAEAQKQHAAQVEATAAESTKTVSSRYETELKQLESYYAKKLTNAKRTSVANGVCFPPGDSSSGSDQGQTGKSTSGSNGGPSDQVSCGESLEGKCAVTTLMLLDLQKWEREQEAAYQ